MESLDRSSANVSLPELWTLVGNRMAVASGTLVALVALLLHVPLAFACLRGFLTSTAVLLVVRLSSSLIGKTAPEQVADSDAARTSDPEEVSTEERLAA